MVWERTLLDERVFPPGSAVTVGESPRATFTLRADGLGKRHPILRPDRSGAVLALKPGMFGRLNIGGRTVEVEDLANDQRGLADRRGDWLEYRLAPGDGGVLVIGSVGLMFDFVEPPGLPPPAKLGQVLDWDANVNKLFAGAAGIILILALVSRLFAAPKGDFTVEQLPDRFVSFVTEDPEAAKALKKEIDRRREEKQRKKEVPEDRPTKNAKAQPKKVAAVERPEDRETKRIRDKVAKQGMVGAISQARKKDRALSEVLDDGGLGMNLNQALKSLDRGGQARVIASAGDSGMAMPSLVQRRGTADAVGEDIDEGGPKTGRTGRDAARRSRLAGRREAAVSLSMPASAATVTGGTLSKKAIAKVVNDNKGAIRYCYESQLTRYPTLRGKVVVDFIIEPSGAVKTIKLPGNSLSNKSAAANVASCLMRMIRRWRFPKPKGGKVRVIYPFTFGRTR